MSRVRTTHPRYVPPMVQGLAVASFLIILAVAVGLAARILGHIS